MHIAQPTLAEAATTRRHPHTGALIEPLWIRPDGRKCWPILGASPDDGAGSGGQGAGDNGSGSGSGTGAGSGSGAGSGGASGTGGGNGGSDAGTGQRSNATDAQGNDLGYPKDTPIAEMNDKEQAAYWRNHSRRHEGRLKDVVGDRTPEQVKQDLAELTEIRKQQQTPAEQALNERFDQGKAEGAKSERTKAATAIFRGALEANGVEGDDLDELAAGFNVAAFLTDDGVDTTKITNFAKRFSPADKGGERRQRDFGAGRRQQGAPERGSAGKAEAERRFKKDKQTTDA